MKIEPSHALVVEDDPVARALLTGIVQGRGHRVEACADAETGWAAYQREFFPLVLLDLKLPGMDGIELCRRIRSLPESEETVILFVTGVDRRDALEEALEAGADDYVTKPLDDEALQVRLAIAERQLREIRDRKRAEQQLMRDALRDPLTDLVNRTLFMERLDRVNRVAIRENRRPGRRKGYLYAVLYVDVDGFKEVNRHFGFEQGDRVLVEAARRIEECVRSIDTVARFTNDEFVILLDNMNDVSDPGRVARRIQQSFARPFEIPGEDERARLTASVGIAVNITGYRDHEEILKDAHRALLRAKNQGGGGYEIFDAVMHARAMARLQLEARLRSALVRDELTLRYQPIVELPTGRLLGFEALVRWSDPERGLILPEEFLAAAEETGLVVPLGWWVLERACRQLKEWQDRFPSNGRLTMGVNVSGKQLTDPEAVEQVSQQIRSSGVAPDTVHLEITETILMTNLDVTGRVLKSLKENAVRVHIDDFGTGYSSLSYLQSFPIDALKIDRSFVNQMTHSPENLEIVRTIVRLARNLDLELVAEGVETEGQLEELRNLECDAAQGYLFSRPVDVAGAEAVLEKDGKETLREKVRGVPEPPATR